MHRKSRNRPKCGVPWLVICCRYWLLFLIILTIDRAREPIEWTHYYKRASTLQDRPHLEKLVSTSYANLALLVSLVIAVVWLSWPFVIRKRLARLSPDRRFVALAMMGVLACWTFMTFLFCASIDSKGDDTVNRICFLYVSPWLVCLPVSIGVYAFIATRRPLMLRGKRAVVCLAVFTLFAFVCTYVGLNKTLIHRMQWSVETLEECLQDNRTSFEAGKGTTLTFLGALQNIDQSCLDSAKNTNGQSLFVCFCSLTDETFQPRSCCGGRAS